MTCYADNPCISSMTINLVLAVRFGFGLGARLAPRALIC
jgi:hypothetical protein